MGVDSGPLFEQSGNITGWLLLNIQLIIFSMLSQLFILKLVSRGIKLPFCHLSNENVHFS